MLPARLGKIGTEEKIRERGLCPRRRPKNKVPAAVKPTAWLQKKRPRFSSRAVFLEF
jgi:hypothetical protein